jgi:hypothetical protein
VGEVARGRAPRAFVTGQPSPVSVAVDDGRVYWTNYEGTPDESGREWGTVVSKSLAKGSLPVTLASQDLRHPTSICAGRGRLYWITAGTGALSNAIHALPLDGGKDQELETNGFPSEIWTHLVLDGDSLYWLSGEDVPEEPAGVYRLRLDASPSGKDPGELLEKGHAIAFAVQGGDLFVTRCAVGAPDPCELAARPLGPVDAAAPGRVLFRGHAEELVADGAYLFWKEAKSGAIFRWVRGAPRD